MWHSDTCNLIHFMMLLRVQHFSLLCVVMELLGVFCIFGYLNVCLLIFCKCLLLLNFFLSKLTFLNLLMATFYFVLMRAEVVKCILSMSCVGGLL